MGKIKVIICPVDRPPYVTNVSDSLTNLQSIVGGYIETVRVATDALLVVNEEKKLMGLPVNPSLLTLCSGDVIVGDAFLCGVRRGELTSLPEGYEIWLRTFRESYKRYAKGENNGSN